MLRAMSVEVTAQTIEPTPTAVVAAAATWAEFPGMWGPMLDKVGPIAMIGDTHRAVREWSTANGYGLAGPHWEIYGDPDPSTGDFEVEVFWLLAEHPGR
jgi:hypothetical protein